MDNHFTINYLQAIKTHLHIDFNTDNRAVFYPDKVCNSDFINFEKDFRSNYGRKQRVRFLF